MSRVQSSLVLNDKMTAVLNRINKAMYLVLDSFEAVQAASDKSFDTTNISAARQEIGKANAAIEEMEQNYRDCDNQQKKLNQSMSSGTSAADGLLKKIKGAAMAWVGMKGVNWIKDSLDLFDTQNKAEVQLAVSLKNMGAAEGALDSLKKRASEIQSYSMYGDEAMIGGAAEFATYMTDDAAISKMMGTLANYAAGMSGGSEVDTTQMVDYATQLGKVLNGTFDGIAKKGFTVTDAQKAIIENGTDMQKALVVDEIINESWEKLAETMAKTPTGRISQMKNAWGDMREELARRIYPSVMRLFDTINANSPKIRRVLENFTVGLNWVISGISKIIEGAAGVYDFISEHWSKIAPIIGEIVTAMLLYKTATFIIGGIEAAAATARNIYAAATIALGTATEGATIAQEGLNTAFMANPIGLIITIILVLIAVFIYLWETCEGFRNFFAQMWKKCADAAGRTYNSVIQPVFNAFQDAQIWVAETTADVGRKIVNVWADIKIGVFKAIRGIVDKMEWLVGIYNKISGVFGGAEINTAMFDDMIANAEKERELSLKGLDMYETTAVTAAENRKLDKLDLDKWYEYTSGMSDKIKDFTITGWLRNKFNEAKKGLEDEGGENPFDGDNTLEGIGDDTSYIADSLDRSTEDLRYLRDLAEQEAINRFTTAEVKIDMTGMTNRIDSNMDLDGVLSTLTEGFAEALEIAAEGVHV